jgi:AraC family transcriptional regulator
MTPLAHGRIILWEGASLWIMDVDPPPGSPQRTDFHSHHAIQVTLALEGQFHLHADDRSCPGPAVVVAADVRHAFEPKGLIALLFVEPESAAGRSLRSTLLREQRVAALPAEVWEDHIAELASVFRAADSDDSPLREIGRRLVQALAGGAEAPEPDTRVQFTLAWVARHLDGRLSISDAASHIGLSVDRMSHLFVEQTGLPFRTYLLWLRLTRAVERYAAGASLTEAAHDAGFADSAHLSRTFRRMFGVAAAELQLA